MSGVARNDFGGPGSNDGEVDLGGVGQALRRNARWIALTTLLGLGASVAFVLLVKPRYTAEAKAIVENQETFFNRADRALGDAVVTAADAEGVASQAQVVLSRDIAREAIRALNLKGNEEFDPAARSPGLLSNVLTMLGLSSEGKALAPEDRIFNNYFDRLTVFPLTKSRVLQIEFSSWDPELAARAANKLADLYIGFQAQAKRDAARSAAGSLATVVADLRAKVAEAERKAEEFRATNGLVLGANNLTMNNQHLAELNTQLSTAKAMQAEAQAKSRLIRDMLRQGRMGEIPDVANNDLIRKLSEQRATLRGQVASETRTLLPGHPRVKELMAQLAELEGNIRAAAEKTVRTLENDARIAGGRVDNLRSALAQQRETVGGASIDESRAKELDREAKLLREQLESSTAKYQEALARQAAETAPSDARIISRAVAPQLPSFPKKVPVVAFATLAAFILSAGAVVAGELLTGRAYVPAARPDVSHAGAAPEPHAAEDARVEAELSVEAAAPAPEPQPELAGKVAPVKRMVTRLPIDIRSRFTVNEDEPSVASVAARISEEPQRDGAMRILVAGFDRDAAPAAVELARALSRSGRTALIETSLEQGAGGRGPLGLSDLIAGRSGFDEIIHADRVSALHLVPAGRGGAILTEGFDTAVEAFAQTYDFVVLLASPLDIAADAQVIATDADLAIVICGAEADDAGIDDATQALRDAGARDVVAINVESAPGEPVEPQREAA